MSSTIDTAQNAERATSHKSAGPSEVQDTIIQYTDAYRIKLQHFAAALSAKGRALPEALQEYLQAAEDGKVRHRRGCCWPVLATCSLRAADVAIGAKAAGRTCWSLSFSAADQQQPAGRERQHCHLAGGLRCKQSCALGWGRHGGTAAGAHAQD